MAILYQPQFKVNGATTWLSFGSPIASVSVAVTGLASNTSYNFQVIASNSFGSTTSAIVTASTTTASGQAPQGSMAGSQTSGTVNPIIAGAASGTAAVGKTLSITGTTITDVTFSITPGVGSFTDPAGTVWTLTAAKDLTNSLVGAVSGGANTAQAEYYNGKLYAQDASSLAWFTYVAPNFTAATAPPVPPPFTVTITTTGGTLTVPTGGTITGSGTASVSVVGTLPICQAAVAGVVLTAPNVVTSVNVKLAAFNPTTATNSITIPIAVTALVPPTAPTSPTVS